jgi:hypothetical protein
MTNDVSPFPDGFNVADSVLAWDACTSSLVSEFLTKGIGLCIFVEALCLWGWRKAEFMSVCHLVKCEVKDLYFDHLLASTIMYSEFIL